MREIFMTFVPTRIQLERWAALTDEQRKNCELHADWCASHVRVVTGRVTDGKYETRPAKVSPIEVAEKSGLLYASNFRIDPTPPAGLFSLMH